MLSIISEIQCDDYNCNIVNLFNESKDIIGENFNTEDVFIARELYKHRIVYEKRMPTFQKQLEFSVETIWYYDPIFVHKVWNYLHPINSIELMAKVFSMYDNIKSYELLFQTNDHVKYNNNNDSTTTKKTDEL